MPVSSPSWSSMGLSAPQTEPDFGQMQPFEMDGITYRMAVWMGALMFVMACSPSLTAGLTGALLGSKLLRFNRNQTIVCGIRTGALSGYFFTQEFLSSHLVLSKKNLAQQPFDQQRQTDSS
ncbi:hypothetical protein EDD16DRAFT_1588645 [Pisolithus croceorrhizus]|nr:hypothetical protein EDD16DRAFT_1588645 [Pisolithus croceorrhizus]